MQTEQTISVPDGGKLDGLYADFAEAELVLFDEVIRPIGKLSRQAQDSSGEEAPEITAEQAWKLHMFARDLEHKAKELAEFAHLLDQNIHFIMEVAET